MVSIKWNLSRSCEEEVWAVVAGGRQMFRQRLIDLGRGRS